MPCQSNAKWARSDWSRVRDVRSQEAGSLQEDAEREYSNPPCLWRRGDQSDMTETHPKSRLKRKKPPVEEPQPEVTQAAQKKSRGPGDCAAAWWNTEQLCDAEALWALTLKSALPYLDHQRWDPLPDLPLPSTELQQAALRHLDEQGWCDLSEEVAALPAPPPRSHQEDHLHLSSSRRSKPAADSEAASLPTLAGRCRLPLCGDRPSDRGPPSSAGSPSVKRGVEEEERDAPPPVSNQVKEAEDRAHLQQGDRGGRGGAAELKSCPMCLLEFPAGFTQMECDGHLAQCLSEMNADMTW